MVKFFIATGLAVASANECGTCWEADEAGQCVPQAGLVTTTCGSNSIQVSIDACLLEGTHDYADAFVGTDASGGCGLTNTDGTLTLEHGLEECGTSMSYDEENQTIVFTNQLTVPSTLIDDMIFTSSPISWSFACAYETSYDITADEMTVDASARTGEFSATGQFDVSMSFYNSIDFDEVLSSDATHQVGKQINFGVTFNNGNAITGLQFAPTSCEVVNVNNEDEVYQLWDSTDELMCHPDQPHPVNFEVFLLPDHNQFFGLTYQGFAFDSVEEASGQQLLKCHVEICHADTEDSVCETGCFDSGTTSTEAPTTEATTREATTTEAATTAPLGGCDPTAISASQYCYTIPDSYYYYDYYDNDDYYYHAAEEIQAGGVITMSRTCAPDYHVPGGYYMHEDQYGDYGCDYFGDCVGWGADILLLLAAPTDNGYITPLNCPQCGCTENDIITLDERNAGTRTMSGGYAALRAKLAESRNKK